MAMANKTAPLLIFSALVMFLILVTSPRVECRALGSSTRTYSIQPNSWMYGGIDLVCTKVYGAQSEDTCFAITQKFNLSRELFSILNPNLNCDKIFVGQWLCLEGAM